METHLEAPAVDVASQSGVSKEDDPQSNQDMPEKPHESSDFVPRVKGKLKFGSSFNAEFASEKTQSCAPTEAAGDSDGSSDETDEEFSDICDD